MSTCNLPQLQADACENKFSCLDSKVFQAILLQLLCNIQQGGGTGGATQFVQLTDVPNSYAGSAGFIVQVNATGTGLEFTAAVAGAPQFFTGNYAGGTPTDVPTTASASAVDTSNNTTWYWYAGAWHATQYISPLTALTAATAYTFAHGLGATPKTQVVLVCTANDANTGLLIGDELNISSVFDVSNVTPAFSVISNATNVIIAVEISPAGSETNFGIIDRAGGTTQNPSSWNNFSFRVYAHL